MTGLVQTHHGISCSDINATKKVLRVLGFTAFQPGAPEPLIYKNKADDYIGQITAATLGDEYHTHYVENPNTGHQVDLIEIQPEAMTPRSWQGIAQSDLVIGIPVDDPWDMYQAMQAADPTCKYSEPLEVPDENGIRFTWRDGQVSILTRNKDPFAILHYNAQDWPKVRSFYEDVLQIPVEPLPSRETGCERFSLQGIKGRMDVEVRASTPRIDFRAWGKHYPAANHFRLIERNFAHVEAKIASNHALGYLIPPQDGFAFIHGPTSETIEIFDKSFGVTTAKDTLKAAE